MQILFGSGNRDYLPDPGKIPTGLFPLIVPGMVIHLPVWRTIPMTDGTERDVVRVTARRLCCEKPETMEDISRIAEACGLKSCPIGVLNILMQERAIFIGDYAPEAVHAPDKLLYFVLPRP